MMFLISILCICAALGQTPLADNLKFTPSQEYHIATDKPVYKPNDVMFIEVFAVDKYSKIPMTEVPIMKRIWDTGDMESDWHTEYQNTNQTMRIQDSNENEIFSSESNRGSDGTIVFTYKIPGDQEGGQYFVSVGGKKRLFRIESY